MRLSIARENLSSTASGKLSSWWNIGDSPDADSGVLSEGEDGKRLVANYGQHMLLPQNQFQNFQRPPATIPRKS